jgi:hypothetical protein
MKPSATKTVATFPVRVATKLLWHRHFGLVEQYVVLVYSGDRLKATCYFGEKEWGGSGRQRWGILIDGAKDRPLILDKGDVVVELVNWKLWKVVFVGEVQRPCLECEGETKPIPKCLCEGSGISTEDYESVFSVHCEAAGYRSSREAYAVANPDFDELCKRAMRRLGITESALLYQLLIGGSFAGVGKPLPRFVAPPEAYTGW